MLSREEIRAELLAAITPEGKLHMKGITSEKLASWGVPWPPPKGWLKKLKTDCGLRAKSSSPDISSEIASEPPPLRRLFNPEADSGLQLGRVSPKKVGVVNTDVPALPKKLIGAKIVSIHTDGACVGNPGPGGWAAVLIYGEHRREIVGTAAATTNNRMELMAAIFALESLREPCNVQLHSDSRYVIDGITKWIVGWKRNDWIRKRRKAEGKGDTCSVPNADLWQRLDAARQNHDVEWIWVKGHAGTTENERCDVLAETAARKASLEVSSISTPSK